MSDAQGTRRELPVLLCLMYLVLLMNHLLLEFRLEIASLRSSDGQLPISVFMQFRWWTSALPEQRIKTSSSDYREKGCWVGVVENHDALHTPLYWMIPGKIARSNARSASILRNQTLKKPCNAGKAVDFMGRCNRQESHSAIARNSIDGSRFESDPILNRHALP
jgi:hypothetical protein